MCVSNFALIATRKLTSSYSLIHVQFLVNDTDKELLQVLHRIVIILLTQLTSIQYLVKR